MTRKAVSTQNICPKTLILCAYTPYNDLPNSEYYCDEFTSLVETVELPYAETMFMKLRSVDNNTFLTKGKLHELAEFCEANEIKQIVISEILTAVQERNMEDI